MDISVVIVSYNTKEYLKNCLQSLKVDGFEGQSEIFVVDNASTDGSADMVEQQFLGLTLVRNKSNLGFSTAVNQAYALSSGRYVLLLNPDTLVLPGAIADLVSFLEDHPEVGAVGPRQWLDPKKILQSTVTTKPPNAAIMLAQIPFLWRFAQKTLYKRFWIKDFEVWNSHSPVRVDSLNGSCMLVRRDTIEDVGSLDEDYFLFFEDVDWSVRMINKGWELFCVPGAEIIHFGMRSVLSSEGIHEISQKSLNYYIKKHKQTWEYVLWKVLGVKRLLHPVKRVLVKIKNLFPVGKWKKKDRLPETPEGDLAFQWESSEGSCEYLIEISPDPLFLYKAGAIVGDNSFVLPADLAQSGPEADLLWRVAPVYDKNRLGVFTKPRPVPLVKVKREEP